MIHNFGYAFSLTGIIFHTDALNTVRHIGETSQACHKPAITQIALLDVSRKDVLHKNRLLVNLMYTLHSFWYI